MQYDRETGQYSAKKPKAWLQPLKTPPLLLDEPPKRSIEDAWGLTSGHHEGRNNNIQSYKSTTSVGDALARTHDRLVSQALLVSDAKARQTALKKADNQYMQAVWHQWKKGNVSWAQVLRAQVFRTGLQNYHYNDLLKDAPQMATLRGKKFKTDL